VLEPVTLGEAARPGSSDARAAARALKPGTVESKQQLADRRCQIGPAVTILGEASAATGTPRYRGMLHPPPRRFSSRLGNHCWGKVPSRWFSLVPSVPHSPRLSSSSPFPTSSPLHPCLTATRLTFFISEHYLILSKQIWLLLSCALNQTTKQFRFSFLFHFTRKGWRS
jgi:hypothetical protein